MMPNPVVRQSQLAKLRHRQEEFAAKNVIFLCTLQAYRAELQHSPVITGPVASHLHLCALPFHTQLKLLEMEQDLLNETLTVCHDQREGGQWELQPGSLLVLRRDRIYGRTLEDELVEGYASVRSDIVATQKCGADGRVLWSSRHCANISGLSYQEIVGKSADEIWPGEQGGHSIRQNETSVWNDKQPRIYHEPLIIMGTAVDRISIRFVVPDGAGGEDLAVVCFDAKAIVASPDFSAPSRLPAASSRSGLVPDLIKFLGPSIQETSSTLRNAARRTVLPQPASR